MSSRVDTPVSTALVVNESSGGRSVSNLILGLGAAALAIRGPGRYSIADVATVAAARVWTNPRMFHARKKLAGYRLVATDTDWTAGHGQKVTGPISALLLLLTGRPAALAHLSGPGAATLQTATSNAPA